jgi:hypothetical protein
MRRIAILLAVATALALTTVPAAFAQDDQDCADFDSQAAAQAHLRADPSDPDGLDAKPGPADGNDQAGGDGIACENNPAPYDRQPVFPPSPAPAPADAASQQTGGALADTGPREAEFPLAVGLLALGAAIVTLAGSYRPRHARR